MNIIRKNQAVQRQNASTSVSEYPFNDTEINGAVIELRGRYPVQGRAVNMQCKEMAYVLSGSGKIVFVSCTPAWHPDQHKYVD